MCQLRYLGLVRCNLTEVPAALAGKESVTRLDLSGNPIKSGWEHLRPLTRLQELRVAVDTRFAGDAQGAEKLEDSCLLSPRVPI